MKNMRPRFSRITLAAPSPFLTNLNGRETTTKSTKPRVLALVTEPGVHEFYAESPADAVTLNGFGLGVGLSEFSGGDLVWAIHDLTGMEIGRPHGSGLHQMGIPPEKLLLVRVRDVRALLSVGEDALRTNGISGVVLSAWGEDRTFSLTASRRLSLAARTEGKRLLMMRAGANPQPSAAESRWSVRSAPSTALAGGAPGRPAFSATLLRHRKSAALGTWMMEWDRETRSLVEQTSLSGGLVPLATKRSAKATEYLRRRA